MSELSGAGRRAVHGADERRPQGCVVASRRPVRRLPGVVTVTIARILIHPQQDEPLYAEVYGILKRAIAEHPETFDEQVDVPTIVDHFGYHDSMRSAVVLSVESPGSSLYHRLTIRLGLHPVFDELLAAVLRYWKVNENVSD